ncbi:hypothetical protein CSIM01_12409 [Colletotrichum simmondsii]|uniref:Uncharacterized protein n=1 Tax=Colletotrichum simmondsii TaxID=703756 RepID=A0A135RSN7_9PEZI|nr:hypothetical protein CSIM01_12409 [Colletotrichum simmondsii]
MPLPLPLPRILSPPPLPRPNRPQEPVNVHRAHHLVLALHVEAVTPPAPAAAATQGIPYSTRMHRRHNPTEDARDALRDRLAAAAAVVLRPRPVASESLGGMLSRARLFCREDAAPKRRAFTTGLSFSESSELDAPAYGAAVPPPPPEIYRVICGFGPFVAGPSNRVRISIPCPNKSAHRCAALATTSGLNPESDAAPMTSLQSRRPQFPSIVSRALIFASALASAGKSRLFLGDLDLDVSAPDPSSSFFTTASPSPSVSAAAAAASSSSDENGILFFDALAIRIFISFSVSPGSGTATFLGRPLLSSALVHSGSGVLGALLRGRPFFFLFDADELARDAADETLAASEALLSSTSVAEADESVM